LQKQHEVQTKVKTWSQKKTLTPTIHFNHQISINQSSDDVTTFILSMFEAYNVCCNLFPLELQEYDPSFTLNYGIDLVVELS
jgi:hypothetical protein